MGLGQTDQVEALIDVAKGFGKGYRFAIDSIGSGEFGRNTIVEDGKVVEIRWGACGLESGIPVAVARLGGLKRLTLDRNRISGHIPDEIGWLVNLEALDLRDNKLTGSIPPAIGWLTKLNTCYLCDNNLSGAIPYEVSDEKLLFW